MIDLLSRIAPPEVSLPALLAGAAWIGLNHAVIAPEIAERLARKHYVPECSAATEAQEAERLAAYETRVARLQSSFDAKLAAAREKAEKIQAEIERRKALTDSLIGTLLPGDLLDALDPDGVLRELAEGALPSAPQLKDLGLMAPDIPPAPEVLSAEGRDAACAQAADTVLDAHRWDWAFYTASATFYAPASVRDIGGLIAGKMEGYHE